ncbi:hypothetical protein SB748_25780 [Rhizobium sp. SIMBA_035]
MREDFGTQAARVIDLWQRLETAQPAVFDMINSLEDLFCSWTKAQTKAGFARLLCSANPMYERIHPTRSQTGDRSLISLAKFAVWENAARPSSRVTPGRSSSRNGTRPR